MDRRPRCGNAAANLYPLPPAVITKDLVGVLAEDDGASDFRTCDGGITDLMERG